ncbi:MAG: agmatine deiminase family protein [Desulfuromonadales bacterium]|nr:agmatine deiminase family protein [Desulfuromonadales bacterium]NIR34279.1 agmatine deiminase family protein [Desulfuromonadales bacterium]NIS42857.1 agmatine deiminase family protein [Desulfuromonadales bacterium]
MKRRLPAEWEPQDAVLIAWPHPESDWAPTLEEVEPVFLELAKAITHYEDLIVVAPEAERLRRLFRGAGIDLERIRIHTVPTNDTWCRDFGPITVFDSDGPHLLDFGFNGWGLKFAADHDNRVNRRLHAGGVFGATPLEIEDLILEGGSIESDGRGTLLTTSRCLLEANRNPALDARDIERTLRQKLGADRVLWLENGALQGDDTDSHVDTLARFCPDDTIAYVRCDTPDDPHYAELKAMENELRAFRDASGAPYRLLPLPWPPPCFDDEGHRLPATYANFLVINKAVLVPTYGSRQDDHALQAIEQAFPDRDIIGIDCLPLIRQHGSLHCVTMQIPRGVVTCAR